MLLSITPFLVGFSADDSTGWSVGAGVSRSRTQYVTGCSPKFYSMRQTEINARIDYVQARNPERRWSPTIQLGGDVSALQAEKTLLADERGGSTTLGTEDTLYVFLPQERITSAPKAALLGIHAALAWKYVDLSLGVVSTLGNPIGQFISDNHDGDSTQSKTYLFPTGGLRLKPWGGLYASVDLLPASPTPLSSSGLRYGLGHQNRDHDFTGGILVGLRDEAKAFLSVEQRVGRVILLASGSVFIDVGAQQAAPLRPGDWGDLGLAFRIPLQLGR